VGFFPQKPDKSAKMKALEVRLAPATKKNASKPAKSSKKSPKPMSFTEWVEHYAKMSGGNPV
jgi:hypothetical protein